MATVPLAPYVSALLADRLAGLAATVDGRAPSVGIRIEAAVLVVDISGFTALTERHAAMGPEGAERLAAVTNGFFDQAISAVHEQGGDVASFAGDAIVAVWPADVHGRPGVVRAAAACGRLIQGARHENVAAGERPIRMRAGVAIGEVVVGLVGDAVRGRRPVFGGTTLADAGRAAALGEAGDVVVTGAAALAGGLEGPILADGHRLVTNAEVGDAMSPLASRRIDDDVLRGWIAPELCSLLDMGHGDWLAEFRRVSVAFVAVDGLDWASTTVLDELGEAVRIIGAVAARYEGMLHQVHVDEKGTVVILAWGTPERTHEDDPARALEATAAAIAGLGARGMPARAGVTEGRLFAGLRGNEHRREYALLGDSMNLAARLMQGADRDVRADAAIARLAGGRVSTEALGPVMFKGKAQPVDVVRVLARAAAGTSTVPTGALRRAAPALIGREREAAELRTAVDVLRSQGRGGVVLLVGDPGIGKSSILAGLDGYVAPTGDVLALRGDADAIERATGYYVWRRPLAQLLGAGPDDRAGLEAAVRRAFADDPIALDRASLLGAILPLELPQTARTAGLESEVRADGVRDSVVHLLRSATARQSVLLVLDDAHWFDSASWSLVLDVARAVPGLLLVIATRPLVDPAPVEWQRLAALPGTIRLELVGLERAAVAALIRDTLGVEAVEPDVASLVGSRAEGNPFFTEQLALALRESRHLVVRDGVARLAPGTADAAPDEIPTTIGGVITGRIDRLSPQEQLTLKVASVIGRLFRYQLLSEVHPVSAGDPRLLGELDRTVRMNLTLLDEPDPDRAYLFKHVITQQVAYELLVFAQRRPLHRAVAEWYEAHADELEPLLPLLAHHWSRAEVPDKALHYLDRAAGQAIGNHANTEALRFLERALRIDADAGHPTDAHVRARWERWSGIALVKLGRYGEAQAHFEESLVLDGRPNPRGRPGVVAALLREVAVQVRRRAWTPRLADVDRERALGLSEVHRYLAEVDYFATDIPRWAHATLTSANIAEPAGDTRELLVAFASVRFLCGLLLLSPLERYYQRLVDRLAERVASPDAIGYSMELESVYAIVVADWDRAYRRADDGAAIFREVGDVMRWHTCFSLVAYADMHRGRLEEALPRFEEGLAALGPDGHKQGILWSLAGIAGCRLAAGEDPGAVIGRLEALLGPDVHHDDAILVHGLVGLARLRSGDRKAALRHARTADRLLRGLTPNSWHAFEGIAAVAEIWLACWAEAGGGRRGPYSGDAARAVRRFARFALLNPQARPRARVLEGRRAAIAGDAVTAERTWKRAAVLAERAGMPGDARRAREGLASLEIGRES